MTPTPPGFVQFTLSNGHVLGFPVEQFVDVIDVPGDRQGRLSTVCRRHATGMRESSPVRETITEVLAAVAAAGPPASIPIRLLFAPTPGTPDLTFVEAEAVDGRPVRVGEWSIQQGFHVLTLPVAAGGVVKLASPARCPATSGPARCDMEAGHDGGHLARSSSRDGVTESGWVTFGPRPVAEGPTLAEVSDEMEVRGKAVADLRALRVTGERDEREIGGEVGAHAPQLASAFAAIRPAFLAAFREEVARERDRLESIIRGDRDAVAAEVVKLRAGRAS